MKAYTVAVENVYSADECAEKSAWDSAYTDLEVAKLACVEDLLDYRIECSDLEPGDGLPDWTHSEIRNNCYILDDQRETFRRWTIQEVELS